MVRRYLCALAIAVGLCPLPELTLPRVQAAEACGQLMESRQPNVTINAATAVEPGAFAPASGNAAARQAFASLKAFCRVQATLTPTPDSDIKIEVWMPADGWNGRFQAVGGRALGGIIVYPAMARALAAGYVTASTDTGHVGPGGTFADGHPEKVIDHGHRAIHDMTVTAERLLAQFYGRAAQQSYFNGCSLGGRQGLAEAQRYPSDYDGIIVGDIANDITGLYAARLAQHQFAHRTAEAVLTDGALRTLNAGAVAACDQLDGVRDGVIENPRQCHFDPGVLACGAAGAPADCLNAEQVATARRMYAPVAQPDDGRVVSNGLMPGSEAGWRAVLGAEPEINSVEVYRHMVFKNPQWDWHAFDLRSALTAARTSQLNEVDATDPDLRTFFGRGGKLLMTHGWADPQTPPLNGIDYFTRVRSAVGAQADAALRLFMVPGMGHCEGGVGTDVFDPMVPLTAWVEHGTAPVRIDASRVVDGRVVRTRPLCPYPQVARWNGSGDTDQAASFTCAAP
jgi:feruloyl esterase